MKTVLHTVLNGLNLIRKETIMEYEDAITNNLFSVYEERKNMDTRFDRVGPEFQAFISSMSSKKEELNVKLHILDELETAFKKIGLDF